MTRHIEHVTLTTGHRRRSERSEISDEAIAACLALIERIGAGAVAEAVPIPGVTGYHLSGRVSVRCMVATVWHETDTAEPIATIGIAAHSWCGAKLWRELHRRGAAVTDPERCPPEPWVAAALDGGIAQHPDAAQWLGDFERCLAWAFVGDTDAR